MENPHKGRPTHLFLATVTPSQEPEGQPPLENMPVLPHRVTVTAWALEFALEPQTLEPLEPLEDVTPVLEAVAVMEPRRVSPWHQAKKTVLPALDAAYSTPGWSIDWATSRQAYSGRGAWKAHTAVMDSLADYSRDLAAAWDWYNQDALAQEDHSVVVLDSALAENGEDPRNWVGLGRFTHGLPVVEPRPEPDAGTRWASWHHVL